MLFFSLFFGFGRERKREARARVKVEEVRRGRERERAIARGSDDDDDERECFLHLSRSSCSRRLSSSSARRWRSRLTLRCRRICLERNGKQREKRERGCFVFVSSNRCDGRRGHRKKNSLALFNSRAPRRALRDGPGARLRHAVGCRGHWGRGLFSSFSSRERKRKRKRKNF